jgi:twitching motility protein PilT
MPLVDSLLTAIVRSDGDALVLHVGEKPYVVAATGAVELSRQGLGLGAMEGLLAQLLSADALRGLREMGAVEHELASSPAGGADRFTVVAARGGDDIWIELRRHRRVRPPFSIALDVPTPENAPAATTTEQPVAPVVASTITDEATTAEPLGVETRAEDTVAPPVVEAPAATVVEEPTVADGAASAHVETEVTHLPEAAEIDRPSGETFAPDDATMEPAALAPEDAEPAWVVDTFAAETVVASRDADEATSDTPAVEPVVEIEMPRSEEAFAATLSEVWAIDHVPAIDFAPPVDEPAAEPAPLHDEMPTAAMPASFEAALAAPVVPPVEPLAATVPEPAPESPAPGSRVEPEPPVPAPQPVAPAAPEPAAVPLAPAAAVPEAPSFQPAVPEFAAPAPPPVFSPAAAATPAASATMSTVPLAPEPPTAPPVAPPVEPSAAPRYDLPAAAASPRAPMPHVEPAVPEPPAYRPIEPQPTLPGLPMSAFDDAARVESASDTLPGVVLSLTRDSARAASQSSRGHGRAGGIERLLRLAAARGASALYLTTQARPAVRVDGDIRLLEGESPLSSGDVEAAVLELAPEGARDKESAEWIRDLQDVGRVRITTFRDYRGPGALLRMISARATSAEQLGLVREIQALAMEPEGLVIVTGPRASGKSTLVSAFVDLINRQRNDYVITLEGQIRLVHESRGSLISQRELRGSAGEIVSAARAALRENPDVLIIEDLRSPDVLQVALDAAGSGLLVFASVTAASATASLERLVDLCPSEQRRTVRAALAEHLRGVVAQVLLRKAGGGRLAARELVLNTNAVAALVSDGQIAQLPRAIDSGRKLGMAPLNDALVAFVQSGAVDVREAYRKADDKVGLLGLLRREGIDTSFVERLA